MKRAWVVAAIPLLWTGCKPQAVAPPAAAPCTVDLSRLVAADPRWAEVRAMDARIVRLRRRLRQPAPPSAKAAFPAPLPPIAAPQPAAPRPLPESLKDLDSVRDAALRTQRKGIEQRQQARVEGERVERETIRDQMGRHAREEAFEKLWEGQRAIIQRYQPGITRLQILKARLAETSPIPDPQGTQAKRLSERTRELAELERRRAAELQDVERRILGAVEQEQKRRGTEDEAAIQEIRARLRSELDIELRTAEQEWQDRIDAAGAALQEPPPGPVGPLPERTAPPSSEPRVTIAGAKEVPASPEAALGHISRQRLVLVRALEAETRGRVLGIAARCRLRPSFGRTAGVPDRTEFFLKEIREPTP